MQCAHSRSAHMVHGFPTICINTIHPYVLSCDLVRLQSACRSYTRSSCLTQFVLCLPQTAKYRYLNRVTFNTEGMIQNLHYSQQREFSNVCLRCLSSHMFVDCQHRL